jgi:hypothetical protein
MLRRLASNWRFAGIVSVRSGDRLTVVSERDNAFNGQAPERQRVAQISNDVYGPKTLESYLNRAAFTQPAPGTFGNHERNSLEGPRFWKIDLAVTRLLPVTRSPPEVSHRLPLRPTPPIPWGSIHRGSRPFTHGSVIELRRVCRPSRSLRVRHRRAMCLRQPAAMRRVCSC